LFFFFIATEIFAEGPAIVAVVNGTSITQKELDDAISALVPRSTYHGSVSKEKNPEFSEKALDDLIARELQYQDALARGMKPEKSMVKERMRTIRDRYGSKKEYQDALVQSGLTEEMLESLVKKDVLIAAVIEKEVTLRARMEDAELKAYYAKNEFKFKEPEKIRLRIISAKDEKKAKESLERLKSGEDFGRVAATMSDDSYRVMGGDVGFIHRGRILQELEDIAFAMKVKEQSGIIKAGDHWYILKVEDKKAERLISFEDAKAKLKTELEQKREKELLDAWTASLRLRAKIEIIRSSQ